MSLIGYAVAAFGYQIEIFCAVILAAYLFVVALVLT
jgi:hypothetical protein